MWWLNTVGASRLSAMQRTTQPARLLLTANAEAEVSVECAGLRSVRTRVEPGRCYPTAKIERLLIVRLSAMGDVIHSLPAVESLRRAFPQAHIGWLIEERWAELLCAPECGIGAGRVLRSVR